MPAEVRSGLVVRSAIAVLGIASTLFELLWPIGTGCLPLGSKLFEDHGETRARKPPDGVP